MSVSQAGIASISSAFVLYTGFIGWNAVCQDTGSVQYGMPNTNAGVINDGEIIQIGGTDDVTYKGTMPQSLMGDAWKDEADNPYLEPNLAKCGQRFVDQSGEDQTANAQTVWQWRAYVLGYVTGGLGFIWTNLMAGGFTLWSPIMASALAFAAMTSVHFYMCMVVEGGELACILNSFTQVFDWIIDLIKNLFSEIWDAIKHSIF